MLSIGILCWLIAAPNDLAIPGSLRECLQLLKFVHHLGLVFGLLHSTAAITYQRTTRWLTRKFHEYETIIHVVVIILWVLIAGEDTVPLIGSIYAAIRFYHVAKGYAKDYEQELLLLRLSSRALLGDYAQMAFNIPPHAAIGIYQYGLQAYRTIVALTLRIYRGLVLVLTGMVLKKAAVAVLYGSLAAIL